MPTVIDSLVVSLSLDARGFSEAQERAIDRLRKLELEAKKTGGNVEKSGLSVLSFFRAVEQPFASLRQHFERLAVATAPSRSTGTQRNLALLAQQGRRTGEDVRQGALAGAAGLRVLGIAGVAAFTAVTALSKVMSGASENAGAVFRTGIGAAAANVPVQAFSAASRALLRRGVPEESTGAFLGTLGQFQAKAKIPGEYDPAYANALQRAGITGDVTTKAPLEILRELAVILNKEKTDSDAIAKAAVAGIADPRLAVALRNAGGGLSGEIAAQVAGGQTAGQTKGAGDLIAASGELTNAWNNLSRIVYDELRPTIEKLYGILANVADFFAAHGTARELAGDAAWGPLAIPKYLFDHTVRKWFGGGTPGPQSALQGGGGGGDEASIRDVIKQAGEASGLNPAQIRRAQDGFLSAFAFESNLRHDVTRKGGSDTGWAQWVGPRLSHMRGYGDPHSLEANRKQLFYELTGPYKNYLMRAGRAGSDSEAAEVAHYFESGGAPQFEGAVKRGHMALANAFGAAKAQVTGDTWKPTRKDLQQYPEAGARDVNQDLGTYFREHGGFLGDPGWHEAIRGAQASRATSNGGDTTVNHGDIQVGHIDVTVHEGNPGNIGQQIGNHIRSSVTQANTGLN